MEFTWTVLPVFTFTTDKFRNYFRKGMIKNMFSRIQGTQNFSSKRDLSQIICADFHICGGYDGFYI